jgi:hypothetical protein
MSQTEYSHLAMPPWWEPVPLRLRLTLYIPSPHWAVQPTFWAIDRKVSKGKY